jgi:hypothetical protein
MKKKQKDRHLDVPAEANRDKHINFVALENDERDEADTPATGALADDENNEHNGDSERYRIRKRNKEQK